MVSLLAALTIAGRPGRDNRPRRSRPLTGKTARKLCFINGRRHTQIVNSPTENSQGKGSKAWRIAACISVLGLAATVLLIKTQMSPGSPTFVTEAPLPGGVVAPQIVATGDRAALIGPDGSLWAWGGTESELSGLTERRTITQTPVRVGTDSNWAQVALGARHTVALKTNGSLWVLGTDRLR